MNNHVSTIKDKKNTAWTLEASRQSHAHLPFCLLSSWLLLTIFWVFFIVLPPGYLFLNNIVFILEKLENKHKSSFIRREDILPLLEQVRNKGNGQKPIGHSLALVI